MQIGLSVVNNRPTGFIKESRTLGFAPDAKLGFAIVKNGTADQILAGQTKEIVFSTTTNFISSVTANTFKLSFDGLRCNNIK